jgi:hypothetical protein
LRERNGTERAFVASMILERNIRSFMDASTVGIGSIMALTEHFVLTAEAV